MPINESIFGLHAEALRVHQQRLELIASNLANADTPHYRARDLDFKAALAQAAGEAEGLSATRPGHQTAANAAGGEHLVWRTPSQPSLDGNTVDVQAEQAAYADAAVHYQASLMFTESRLRSLLTAITGE